MSAVTDRADRVFSVFIRVSYADFDGYASCFTCGARMLWQELQCGHWIPRGNGATRFHEDNCRPQCSNCNEHRGGLPVAFEEGLRTDLGDEKVDALLAIASGRVDELAVINKYRSILREKYAIVM